MKSTIIYAIAFIAFITFFFEIDNIFLFVIQKALSAVVFLLCLQEINRDSDTQEV